MSNKNEEIKEVKDEVVEVTEEVMYVSTKDAFRSIGHNIKVKVTDPETYKNAAKKAGKAALKLGAAAAVGFAVSKGVNAIMKNDEEEWTDDEIVDAEDYEVTNADESEAEETNQIETEENETV